MDFHLAQLNIGRMVAPLDDARMAGFVGGLLEINALADAAPGFVWRLVDENGNDATGLRPFGVDDVIVNMSTWESLETLREYVFRTAHLEYLRRRREWFRPFGDVYTVLWWVPAGHRPTVQEASDRLTHLREHGATPEAFTLRDAFPAVLAG